METVRTAIIGAGVMGGEHVKALAPLTDVVMSVSPIRTSPRRGNWRRLRGHKPVLSQT